MNMLRLFLLLPIVALLGACGHTNNLARFKIAGKTAYYRAVASGDASSSASYIHSPARNTATDILAAIGSAVASAEGRRKLERAINGDSLAHDVSLGIRQATADYLSLRPAESMAEDPDLIIETELTDYTLRSGASGLVVRVTGMSRIIDRRSGEIVWENSETQSIPLSETYLAGIAPQPAASGASIFNAVRLLSLSEEEMRKVMKGAAVDAGREIGETLREDIADMGR